VVDYRGFLFAPPTTDYYTEEHLGYFFVFFQFMPRWFIHVANLARYRFLDGENVTIYDARGKDFSFHETGFTLYKMPRPSSTTNWRSATDIKQFQAEMEPFLREQVPGAKRFEWTYNLVRGGNNLNDQPIIPDGIHLDYTQNDTTREQFYSQYPLLNDEEVTTQLPFLLGHNDTVTEKLAMVLGVWKPIHMTSPVCDHPLAIMDARTFSPDDERPLGLHVKFFRFSFKTLKVYILAAHSVISNIVHRASQRWWYYSMQRTDEVLVFTHYTRGKHFATPHGTFTNPHCTRDMDTRRSVEMRVGVFV